VPGRKNMSPPRRNAAVLRRKAMRCKPLSGKRMTSRALKQIRSTKPEASQRPVRSAKGLLWK
jgi:hypothetical protein